jgi:hypothetical protein
VVKSGIQPYKEEEQSRFCYQCHKFHELDEFRGPDGHLSPRHNCYQSQQKRLKRRKDKDAPRAGKLAAIMSSDGRVYPNMGPSVPLTAGGVGASYYGGAVQVESI